MNFTEIFENENAIYLIVLDKNLGHFIAEIQESDYWLGGDKGSFTNDSNQNFTTLKSAEAFYSRNYETVLTFSSVDERNEMVDEMENNNTWID